MTDGERQAVWTRAERRALAVGDRLVEEGTEEPTLFLVLSGRLEVHSGSVLLGVAEAGDLLGEMALFAGGTRSASITVTEPGEILVLDWDGYDALRQSGHPVASVIERRGLRTLAERLAAVRLQIAAMVVEAESSLPSYQATVGDRLVAGIGWLGLGPGAVPEAVDGLAQSALFAGIPRSVLRSLGSQLSSVVWPRGRRLFVQGAAAGRAYLVSAGRVELFRSVPAGGVWHLGTVYAGQAVGMGALAAGMGERALTAVVRRRLVAWTVDRLTWEALEARSDDVGAAFRVVMIRALAEQLAVANRQLTVLGGIDAKPAPSVHGHGDEAW